MPKLFHIGDILSVTKDLLISPRKLDGYYDILNFMTGDDLYTHQLIRAHNICAPALLRQHPQLKEVDTSDRNEGNVVSWLAEQAHKYGEFLPVIPLSPGKWEHTDPAVEMMGWLPGKPITVMNNPKQEV